MLWPPEQTKIPPLPLWLLYPERAEEVCPLGEGSPSSTHRPCFSSQVVRRNGGLAELRREVCYPPQLRVSSQTLSHPPHEPAHMATTQCLGPTNGQRARCLRTKAITLSWFQAPFENFMHIKSPTKACEAGSCPYHVPWTWSCNLPFTK